MNDQTEHVAERFLTALEQKVQELLVLSKIPISSPAKLSFVDYKKFREKSDECLSFLVIIEGRISEVEGERKDLLSEQFDKLVVESVRVSPSDIKKACANLSDELRASINKAAKNIKAFHKKQTPINASTVRRRVLKL